MVVSCAGADVEPVSCDRIGDAGNPGRRGCVARPRAVRPRPPRAPTGPTALTMSSAESSNAAMESSSPRPGRLVRRRRRDQRAVRPVHVGEAGRIGRTVLGTSPRRLRREVEVALADRVPVRIGAALEVSAVLSHRHPPSVASRTLESDAAHGRRCRASEPLDACQRHHGTALVTRRRRCRPPRAGATRCVPRGRR